ncbi:MAG: hypothetical protein AAGC81_02220 [Pseudomonadota bacterium]
MSIAGPSLACEQKGSTMNHNPYSNVDTGPTGASYDGFIYWTSDGSKDRQFPPCSFTLTTGPKEHRQKMTWTAPIEGGVLFDMRVDQCRRGWELNLEAMPKPERVLAPLTAPFPDKPQKPGVDPADWKPCFSIAVAGPDGSVYLWEQAGVAYDMFRDLMDKLGAMQIPAGQVPHVKAVRVDQVHLTRGVVNVPKFDVLGWVDPSQHFKAGPSQQAYQNEAQGGGSQPAGNGGFAGAGPATPAPTTGSADTAAQNGSAPNTGGGFGGQTQNPQPSPGGFGGAPAQPGGPVAGGQPEF